MTTFVFRRFPQPRSSRSSQSTRSKPSTPLGPTLTLLNEAGLDPVELSDGPIDCRPEDVVLMGGNARFFPRLRRSLIDLPPSRRPFVVIWHTEPLPLPDRANLPPPRRYLRDVAKLVLRDRRANDPLTNYRELEKLSRHDLPGLLVAGHRSGREFLRERGMAAEWVPPGHHPSVGRDLGIERDIDVLFLGTTHSPRRRRLVRKLRSAGIDVHVAGRWNDPRYMGDHRTRLVNRARIFLHLGQRPGEMAHFRFGIGMANRALVVAEPIYDSAPFLPGTHYLSAPVEELPRVIRDALDDDEQRLRVTDAGWRFVNEELTLERSIGKLVALIEQRRAHSEPATQRY